MPKRAWFNRLKALLGLERIAAADWATAADVAVAQLTVALLVFVEPLKAASADVLQQQEFKLAAAKRDQADDLKAACTAYSQVEAACLAQVKAGHAALRETPPGHTDLRALMTEPGGPAFIDQLVASVGAKVSTDGQKGLLRAAIMARFDIEELKGELSTKALPRLYKMLATLPEDHTTGNPKLRKVRRNKTAGKKDGKTMYSASYRAGEIILEAGTAGRRARSVKYTTDKGSCSVKLFDAAMLHEVGHAVDDRDKTMAGATNVAFGKWRSEDEASIIAVAGDDMGFYVAFAAAGKPLLTKLLTEALKGSAVVKPSKLARALNDLNDIGIEGIAADLGIAGAVKRRIDTGDKVYTVRLRADALAAVSLAHAEQIEFLFIETIELIFMADVALTAVEAVTEVFKPVLDANADVDWEALASHKSLTWLSDIGAQTIGNYKLSQSKIEAAAVKVGGDTRVYQQSYKGTYWSYIVDARSYMVRDYQFRARGEWFAEVYTMYFMGKLGNGHIAYSWLLGLYGPPPAA